MMIAAARTGVWRRAAIWGGAALAAGGLAGRLPVVTSAGAFGAAVVVAVVVLEPALGLVLMLGLAPLKTLIATEAHFSLPVDIGQITLALAVFAWSIGRVTQRRFDPLPHTRFYAPLLLIMAGFGPSLFAATSTGAWLSEMLKWVEMLLLVGIVMDLARDGRWAWIAFGVVLAATLQAVIGLYEYFGGSGAPHLWISNFQRFRAFGTFGQPNPFSAFMGLSLPLALGLTWGYGRRGLVGWRERDARRRRYVAPASIALGYAACSGLLLGGLVASWGRGAWLGFGAAGVVMVFFAPRRRRRGAALLAVGAVLTAMMWTAGYVPAGIRQRVQSTLTEFTGFGDMRAVPISDENFALVERLAHWQAAVNMANAHPLAGVGLGNYEAAYPDYGLVSWPRALGHAHNDYLNVLAETGLVGLFGYLAGWAVIVWWTLCALRLSDPVLRGLALGLLGAWTHLAVHSFVDKLYVNNLFLHLGVMLGLAAVAYQYAQRPVEDMGNVV